MNRRQRFMAGFGRDDAHRQECGYQGTHRYACAHQGKPARARAGLVAGRLPGRNAQVHQFSARLGMIRPRTRPRAHVGLRRKRWHCDQTGLAAHVGWFLLAACELLRVIRIAVPQLRVERINRNSMSSGKSAAAHQQASCPDLPSCPKRQSAKLIWSKWANHYQ
jgi:hypothetical protein